MSAFDRDQAEVFLELVFGGRTGTVCLAFGRDPYLNDDGKYRHRSGTDRRARHSRGSPQAARGPARCKRTSRRSEATATHSACLAHVASAQPGTEAGEQMVMGHQCAGNGMGTAPLYPLNNGTPCTATMVTLRTMVRTAPSTLNNGEQQWQGAQHSTHASVGEWTSRSAHSAFRRSGAPGRSRVQARTTPQTRMPVYVSLRAWRSMQRRNSL